MRIGLLRRRKMTTRRANSAASSALSGESSVEKISIKSIFLNNGGRGSAHGAGLGVEYSPTPPWVGLYPSNREYLRIYCVLEVLLSVHR